MHQSSAPSEGRVGPPASAHVRRVARERGSRNVNHARYVVDRPAMVRAKLSTKDASTATRVDAESRNTPPPSPACVLVALLASNLAPVALSFVPSKPWPSTAAAPPPNCRGVQARDHIKFVCLGARDGGHRRGCSASFAHRRGVVLEQRERRVNGRSACNKKGAAALSRHIRCGLLRSGQP